MSVRDKKRNAEYMRNYRRTHPAVKAYQKKYHNGWGPENKEKIRKNFKNWFHKSQENKDKIRNYQLKFNYGLTKEDYEALLKFQNGVCAICERTYDKFLAVDHNHTTGKVRGLLCRNCNLGLGLFEDNVNSLLKAISYLKPNK